MALPVRLPLAPPKVQKWVADGSVGNFSELEGDILLMLEGVPEVLDATALAPFPAFQSSLHEWGSRACGGGGGVRVGCPKLWSDTLPLEWSPEHPAFSLLRALRDDGWFPGSVAARALPIVGKRVSTANATAAKSYDICLLRHEDLMRRGAVRIVAHQNELYYRCLLQVSTTTPPNLTVAEHKALLGNEGGVLPRIGDGDGVVAEGEEPDVASEDGDQLQMWLSELVDDDDPVVVHSLVGLPSLMDRRAVARASAGLESRASSSTAGVAPPEPLASEAAAQESDGAVVLHAPELVEMAFGDSIEGIRMEVEHRDDPTHRYARWSLKCPLRACAHAEVGVRPCCKRRNTGAAQMEHFGVAEVYAYLGVWAREAHAFRDRAEHVRFVPSRAQIAEYCAEKGWLPAGR